MHIFIAYNYVPQNIFLNQTLYRAIIIYSMNGEGEEWNNNSNIECNPASSIFGMGR